ncbi:MAG: hypothetical protein KF730_02740 [Sphingomonas sp.]|uniref:hypothetical protein n=1 Tax=Sphingomonas sp. TaxID=28214 RepID=UPI0025E0A597|nr:hypothetical protein [Sphingomonas sp.]MBX3563473.1 hypothetical protein [Sphingomonas sp.]
MRRADVDLLDPRRAYWVPSVVAPCRDWPAAPGCFRGARFLVDRHTLRANRSDFAAFASKASCMRWMMRHRLALNAALPEARVDAVRLDRWLLGLD